MTKKLLLKFTLYATIPLMGLFLITHFASCKKDKGTSPPKYFTVCFWTDKAGYPIDVVIQRHYGPHFDPVYIGTLNSYTNGPITNCNSANTLTKTIEMHIDPGEDGTPYYAGYQAYLKPPFYYGSYAQEEWVSLYSPVYNENTCNIIKFDRDTTLKKVTFWTANSSYFQNNNYLQVKIGWPTGQSAYKIYKAYPSDPGCGADSTLNAVFRSNTSPFNYYICKNNDSLVFSGTYTMTASSCSTIQIP